jgi:hypothetical protein
MIPILHPDIRIQRLTIGREKAPLLVIDNLIADPDSLVRIGAEKQYVESMRNYPGIRAKAPLSYQQLLVSELRETLSATFQVPPQSIRFNMCHFSLVTAPRDRLSMVQRIPHVDSFESLGLASIHYLFKEDLGGTAFYRHRSTGFEYIDESRRELYTQTLEAEVASGQTPKCEYINADTPLFEQVGGQAGVFNRMIVYRRNSLHSGSIRADFVPDPNPFTGRLSINSFIG